MAQWLRLCTPSAGRPDLILGQGTRSHMPQLRVCMSQLKSSHAAIKGSCTPHRRPRAAKYTYIPGGTSGKESICQCRRCKRCEFDPWIRKIPGERHGNPLVFLPGESHGQRSLAGYSSWGRKEQDMTERLTPSLFIYF